MARAASWLSTGATARKGLVSIVDQAFLSGPTFVTSILLAKFCTEQEFGSYVVAFGVYVFLHRTQTSLVSNPLTVLGSSKSKVEFGKYVSSLFLLQTLLCLIGVAVTGGTAAMVLTALEAPVIGSALLGLTAAVPFLETREFIRRVLFVRLEPGRVLMNDVLYGAAVLAMLFLLKRSDALHAWAVFLGIGAVSALCCVVGLWQIRLHLGNPSGRLRSTLDEQWRFGRWLLVETVASYAFMEVPILLVGVWVGASGAARLGASRYVLAPLQVALFGIANVAGPKAAAVYHQQGRESLNRFLWRVSFASVGIFAVYCLAAAMVPEWPLRLLYGNKYAGELLHVRLWAAIYMLMALRQITTLGLSAMRRPDIIVTASIAPAVLAVLACAATMGVWQDIGALAARLGAELLCFVIACALLVRGNVERSPVVDLRDESIPLDNVESDT